MAPKVTSMMAEQAIKDGAEVKEKPIIKRPKPLPTPIPAPAPDTSSIERSVAALEESIRQHQLIAQQRSDEFLAAIKAITEHNPIRLKVHRNMDRDSPEYLLMEYIDVIPVKFTRKLDS